LSLLAGRGEDAQEGEAEEEVRQEEEEAEEELEQLEQFIELEYLVFVCSAADSPWPCCSSARCKGTRCSGCSGRRICCCCCCIGFSVRAAF
jgi:hypothetical protein